MEHRKRVQSFDEALEQIDRVSDESSSQLTQALKREYSRIKGATHMMRNDLHATARDLKDKSVEKLHQAKDHLRDVSHDVAHKVDHKAHQHPWYFVGVAAFFSALVGFFAGRKTPRR